MTEKEKIHNISPEKDINQGDLSKDVEDTLFSSHKEYLAIINGKGELTGKVCEREFAHENGEAHYSVHAWLINTKEFSGDIGIYIINKSIEGGKSYKQVRSAGGHVSVGEDWKMEGNEKEVRARLLKDSVIREVKEELDINISEENKNGEKNKDSRLDIIFDSIPYSSESDKHINEEHICVFSTEFNGEITNFQKSEIESMDLISSKNLMKMLENDPKSFGAENQEEWKSSSRYKLAVKVLKKIQEKYKIK